MSKSEARRPLPGREARPVRIREEAGRKRHSGGGVTAEATEEAEQHTHTHTTTHAHTRTRAHAHTRTTRHGHRRTGESIYVYMYNGREDQHHGRPRPVILRGISKPRRDQIDTNGGGRSEAEAVRERNASAIRHGISGGAGKATEAGRGISEEGNNGIYI